MCVVCVCGLLGGGAKLVGESGKDALASSFAHLANNAGDQLLASHGWAYLGVEAFRRLHPPHVHHETRA